MPFLLPILLNFQGSAHLFGVGSFSKDNRKKKLTGDLGGGTVDKTVTDFLCTIPELKGKLDGSEDE